MAYGTRKRKPSDVLQSHHHQICLILSTTDAILLPFTAKLFEKHIIDRSTKNEISHNLGYKAADTLLDCLEMKVDVNSSLLQTVFEVMREVDTLKDVVEQMKKERLAKQEDIQDIPLPDPSKIDVMDTVVEAKKLKAEFEELLVAILDAVRDVDLDNLKLRISWFFNAEGYITTDVQAILDQLQSLTKPEVVLNFLVTRNFIGYLNYELTKAFQKAVKSDHLKTKIEKYEENHDAFLQFSFNAIIEAFRQHSELAPVSIVGLPRFSIRLEKPWEGKSVYKWKEVLAKLLTWPSNLIIVSIEKNCIVITYAVLPFFISSVSRDLKDPHVLELLKRELATVEFSEVTPSYQEVPVTSLEDTPSEESSVIESVKPMDKEGKIAPNSIPHIRLLDNPTTLTHQMNTDDNKYIDIHADYLHKMILNQGFLVPVYPLLLTFSGLPDSGKTTALGKLMELEGNELDKVHFTHHELVASDFKSSKVRYAAVACDAGYTFAMQCGIQYNLFVHELGKPQYLDTKSQAFIDPVLTQHVDMVVHHLKQRDDAKKSKSNPLQDQQIISFERSLTTGIGLINVWDNIAVLRKIAPFLQCFSGHYSKNYAWLFVDLDRDLSKLHLPPQLKSDNRFGMKWRSRVQYLLRSCRLCQGSKGKRKRVCTIFAIHETMENLADRLYRLKLECKNAAKQMGVHELVDFDIVAVDVVSKAEQDILRKRMMKLLHDVESQEIPLSWIFLRGSFALHHSTYITRQELQAKANECGITEEELQQFCEFFTSFGSILDVQLIDPNSEYVIIKPVEFLAKLDSFFEEMENQYGVVSSGKSIEKSDFLKILSSVGLAAEIVNPPIVLYVAIPKYSSPYYYIPSVRTGERNVTCSPGAVQLVIGMQSSVMSVDVTICRHMLKRLQNAELILSDMMNAITIETTLSGLTPFKFDVIFQGDVIEIVSHEEHIHEGIYMTNICQEICTVCESMAQKTVTQLGEMKYHFAVTCAEDEHHEISYNIHHRRHVLPFNYDQCNVCLQNGRNRGQITTWNDYLNKNPVEEKFKLNGELSPEDVSMLAVEICQYPWDAITIFAKELYSPISDDHRSKKQNWWFIFQMIMEWAQNQKNESVKKELAMKLISAHDEWKVNEQDVTKKVVRFKRLARKLDIQAFTKNQLSSADYIPGATRELES